MVNAITIEFHDACINGELEKVSKLLCKRGEIDVAYLNDQVTLCKTVEKEHIEIVKNLLEIGVNVNQRDWFDRTPLQYARNPTIAKILLDNGASVDAQNFERATPLFNACYFGPSELVQILLKHNADINKEDRWTYTPLHFVLRSKASGIVEILLENGADLNEINSEGKTLLHQACFYGELKVVQKLLRHHADIDAKGWSDVTPLVEACMSGHLKIVQELLKHKPNINAFYRGITKKFTPLDIAVINGFPEILEELLKHGADISSSPYLHLSIQKRRIEVVKAFLKNGCNTKFRIKKIYNEVLPDCNAFELALYFRSVDIVKIIAFNGN